MSKSDDNTNELESYGVWVKNTAENDNTEVTPADTSDELNLDDGGLDLPDFDDSDFSDMFKEDPQEAAANSLDDFGSEDDTTLSTDELANITGGVDVEQVEAPEENVEAALNFDDIAQTEKTSDEPDAEAEISTESDEINFDDIVSDTEAGEEAETYIDTSEFDTDIPTEEVTDFNTDIPTEEITDFNTEISGQSETESEEISTEDEEISLDDFMDEGFSDESVASGNNGFEPGAGSSAAAAASSETEELSLDDFMDGDSFDSAPEEAKQEETVEDESPLDMDISFDDSADTVETEDNLSLDISADDDDDTDYDTEESESVETEEVSMDDFGSSFTAEESTTPSTAASYENINTEDVDLSDFGIDANAEETPIVQDVEEAKNKEKVIDYDLSVGDENTATAPVVNEIKSNTENTDELEHVVSEPAAADENKTTVDNSLLQQIVSELSNLKDEMNKLKTNLEEIKHEPAVTAVAAGVAAGAAAAAVSNEVDIPEETEEDKGGFFSGDDEDDTIALSFDELDNIMNTADFSDTVEADENADATSDETLETEAEVEEPVVEETVIEETEAESPVIEEPVISEEEPVIEESVIAEEEPIIEENLVEIEAEESSEEPAIEEIVSEDTVPLEEDNIEDDTIIEESIISSEPEISDTTDISDSTETVIENAFSSDESTIIEDIDINEDQTEDSFDFSNEKLEEPEIDDFIPDGNDELFEEEALPDEISIPKEEDLLVESTASDFMDSVKETTEEEEPEELIQEESIDEMELELPEESEEEVIENVITVEADDDIPTVDKVLSEETEPEVEVDAETEAEAENEPEVEESFTSVDSFSEENTIEEPVTEAPVETSFAEVDNLDNTLSDSNLAYLDKTDSETETAATTDLKQDIKSVLLYMDQLLENLPEEKIVEFAKSDEFVTYKKLFSELGLS